MKFTKQHLCDIPYCYAVSQVKVEGRDRILFAAEAVGPCRHFDVETLEGETVWNEPGGTMSIAPVPGRDAEFLSVQRFYPGFDAAMAEIVYVRPVDGSWKTSTLVHLPYVHRIDILESGGRHYLVACTVCSSKKSMEDWSSPGKIYAAELPQDLSEPIALEVIADDMTRNHGYCRRADGRGAFTSCDQGVFELSPPAEGGGTWGIAKILDRPVSDIAFCDIDGDGVDEMATIEPFHGREFQIYRREPSGYRSIYRHLTPMEFCHVVWGGKLRGESVFLGGCRGANQELFILRWQDGKVVSENIESGAGPSNVSVINGAQRDLIAVANREIGEGAVFVVED